MLLSCALLGAPAATARTPEVVQKRVDFARSVAEKSPRKAADALFSALTMLGKKERIALARELKRSSDRHFKAALDDDRLAPLLRTPPPPPPPPPPTLYDDL